MTFRVAKHPLISYGSIGWYLGRYIYFRNLFILIFTGAYSFLHTITWAMPLPLPQELKKEDKKSVERGEKWIRRGESEKKSKLIPNFRPFYMLGVGAAGKSPKIGFAPPPHNLISEFARPACICINFYGITKLL